jgi:hypothetical protein
MKQRKNLTELIAGIAPFPDPEHVFNAQSSLAQGCCGSCVEVPTEPFSGSFPQRLKGFSRIFRILSYGREVLWL